MYLCETELFEIELFWHLKCVLMINWIVWNRSVNRFKNWYGIKTNNGWWAFKPNQTHMAFTLNNTWRFNKIYKHNI